MKKGLIFTIAMLLLIGTVVAQTPQAQAIPSQLMSAVSEMLENVIEINQKTCSDEPIVLFQGIHASGPGSPLMIQSSTNGVVKVPFLLMFPMIEGELVSIKDINFYGVFHANSDVGNTCDISYNGVYCMTLSKNKPLGEDEYFYKTVPSSCIDSLDEDSLNFIEMDCPVMNTNGFLRIMTVFYDATWKSC